MSWAPKFADICQKTHVEQAQWFLNAFWDENEGGKKSAEEVWKVGNLMIELDLGHPIMYGARKKLHDDDDQIGCDLDEFKAHVFLERLGETLTVVALRRRLEQLDIDKNNRLALSEYLIFKYNKKPEDLVNAPQGDNKEEVEEARKKVEAAQEALFAVSEQLKAQTAALNSQKKALAELKVAETELQAAVAELKKEEEAYNNKCKKLEAESTDQSLGIVKRNKAKNLLAQLLGEDPLPLRKAKITQEAALRRVEKQRKEAQVATKELEVQKAKVEEAYAHAEEAVQEAKQFLEDVKKRGGPTHGSIWWMERELSEAQKYLPKRR